MADVVYNRRYSTNQTYDTAFIEHLEDLGFIVDSIPEGDVTTYDYDGVQLFIVGPPDGGWVATYPNGDFVNDLEMPIISLCRGASRNTFGMGTWSGAVNVSAFTAVDTEHEITDGLSGATTIGSSISTHGVASFSASVNLIMHNGSTGNAGLAEITKTISSVDYKRVHFGYHRGDSLNSDGWDIFDRTLQYLGGEGLVLYKLSGTYTTLPVDTTTLTTDIRIRWTADTPTDTSIKVEYSLTELNTAPGTWTEVSESDVITPGLNENYLWLKYTLETTNDEVTPTLEELWLEGLQEQDKILLNFDEQNRFNNVDGNLTVAYSQSVGNLTGDSPVEAFSQAFLPLSLEPDPLDQHIITVEGTELDVDFKLVNYEDGHTDHTITVSGGTPTPAVAFIGNPATQNGFVHTFYGIAGVLGNDKIITVQNGLAGGPLFAVATSAGITLTLGMDAGDPPAPDDMQNTSTQIASVIDALDDYSATADGDGSLVPDITHADEIEFSGGTATINVGFIHVDDIPP